MAELTVTWNQMAYPLTDEYWEPYSLSDTSSVYENEVCTKTWLKSVHTYTSTDRIKRSIVPIYTIGDVLYFSYEIMPEKNQNYSLELGGGRDGVNDTFYCPANEWTRIGLVRKSNSASDSPLPVNLRSNNQAIGDKCKWRYPIYINLTQMFGAGKEPKSTQEFEYQCAVNGINLNSYLPLDSGTSRTWLVPIAPVMLHMKQIISNEPHIETINGKMISFSTDVPATLKQCKINFAPVQSGSGDPSPSNIRPIAGWIGIGVNVSPTNVAGTRYTVNWQTVAGTVYGGYVDLLTGMLVQEWAYTEYDGSSDENWNIESISGNKNFYIMTPSTWKRNTGLSDIICNCAKPSTNLATGDVRVTNSGNLNAYLGPLTSADTVEEFKTWLSSNTMQVCVKLQTPVSYQLSTQTVKTLRGINNIWTGDDTDVAIKYWAHKADATATETIGGLSMLLNNAAYKDHDYKYDTNVYSLDDFFIAGWYDTGDNSAKTVTYFESARHGISSSNWTYVRFYNDKTASSVDYWSNNAASEDIRKVTTLGGRYVATSVYKPDAYKSWMYDHTNRRYIYEGKDARTAVTRVSEYGKRFGGGNPASASRQSYDNGCTTLMFLFPPSTDKQTLVLRGGCGSQIEYKSNGTTYVDWWTFESPTSVTARKIINAGSDGFRFSLDTRYLDEAYAYIQESGFIIFAGKNSIYYRHNNVNEVAT